MLRHLLSIALLPFTVAVLIPIWIARTNGIVPAMGRTPTALTLQVAGFVVGLIGLELFGWSLRRFATDGKGTLAPWDPPRQLVIRGPYRFVRNPMISGVVLLLLAEAALLLSLPHLEWALVFLAINVIYIPLLEEPLLRARFGEPYREYCRHVPRLIPRLRPWTPGP